VLKIIMERKSTDRVRKIKKKGKEVRKRRKRLKKTPKNSRYPGRPVKNNSGGFLGPTK